MRNLINFIWKHHIFFLFLILETVAFYLVISRRNYQNTIVINSSNKVTGTILETYSEITQYFNLRSINEKLAYENAALWNKLPVAFRAIKDSVYFENDTVFHQQYEFRVARVINNSTNRRNNFLTLDKGSSSGIKAGMGVIAPDGVVGQVTQVSENYATVISLLNKNWQLSVKLASTGQLGSVTWDGGNPAIGILNDVARHARVEPGDTVITSEASATFPEGIMVGVVDKVMLVEGDNFFTITVKLSTDFGKLNHVYLIDNKYKEEQRRLEATNKTDDN